MELLQPGKYNMTTAARTDGTNRTNGTHGTNRTYGGGGGGGGVPAGTRKIQYKTQRIEEALRARPGHLEKIKRRGNSDALEQRLGIQRAAWV